MAVPVEVNSFGIFKSIFRTWLRFRGIFFQYEVVARRVWAVWNWVKWVWYQDPFPFDFYVQKWKLESQHHPLLFRRKWPIGEYQKNDWLWLYLWLSNKTRDTCSSTERTRKGRRIEEPDVVSNDGVIDISAIERERERRCVVRQLFFIPWWSRNRRRATCGSRGTGSNGKSGPYSNPGRTRCAGRTQRCRSLLVSETENRIANVHISVLLLFFFCSSIAKSAAFFRVSKGWTGFFFFYLMPSEFFFKKKKPFGRRVNFKLKKNTGNE